MSLEPGFEIIQESPAPSPFAEAWARYEAAYAAHGAACTAYSLVEARLFAKEIDAQNPEYVAVEALQGEACHASCEAFCVMVDTPATSLVEISLKLSGLQQEDMMARQSCSELGHMDEQSALSQLVSDFAALTAATPGDDAALFDLCRQHQAAWDHADSLPLEDIEDDVSTTAWGITHDIQEALGAIPAHTFAGIAAKAQVIERAARGSFDGREINDFSMAPEALLLSLMQDIRRAADPIQALAQRTNPNIRWAVALQAYETAHARYLRARETYDAAHRLVDAQMPDELVDHTRKDHRIARWHRVEALRDDRSLSAAEVNRLAPILHRWTALEAELRQRHGLETVETAMEQALDAQDEAEGALMRTPAPDAAAMALKMRLLSIFADDGGGGYGDLGYVARQLDGYWVDKMPVHVYRDALRLSGQDHPILHMADWSPRQWVERFEERGGWATLGAVRSLHLEMPGGVPGHRPAVSDLMAELYAEPWRARAVELFVGDRRNEGGDPRVHSDGKPRANPSMPSKPLSMDAAEPEQADMAARAAA